MADIIAILCPLPNVPEGNGNKPCRQIQDCPMASMLRYIYYSIDIQIPRIHTLAVGIYGHNIKASQEYEGAAWAAYDIAYRQQACTVKNGEFILLL